MSHTDAIADALTRIRNANQAGFPTVTIPHASRVERLIQVLCREGFLEHMEVVTAGTHRQLVVTLKYAAGQRRVISGLERVSKPGRRIYLGYEAIRPIRSGMGVSIISTPKGVVTDADARRMQVGGEVLCRVW
ncbi:MAG: 30S ribosomal protein S8 [Deltaproteobacteria bacterium]|nr:30S ribosomal protein S8 [Deltaproteobacteria bacterium]